MYVEMGNYGSVSSQGMIASIGIDLAWKESGISGLCILIDGEIAQWDAFAYSDQALIGIVHSLDVKSCIVTIDAPLFVPNDSGIRSCERAFKKTDIHGHFLSVLGSNRAFLTTQFGSIRGESLLDGLRSDKVSVFETFPTASVVGMFGKRIPYKFSAGKTKAGMIDGMHMLLEELHGNGRFSGFSGELEAHIAFPLKQAKTRKDLKFLEDKMDAFICAFTAWQLSVSDECVKSVGGAKDDGTIVYTCFDVP